MTIDRHRPIVEGSPHPESEVMAGFGFVSLAIVEHDTTHTFYAHDVPMLVLARLGSMANLISGDRNSLPLGAECSVAVRNNENGSRRPTLLPTLEVNTSGRLRFSRETGAHVLAQGLAPRKDGDVSLVERVASGHVLQPGPSVVIATDVPIPRSTAGYVIAEAKAAVANGLEGLTKAIAGAMLEADKKSLGGADIRQILVALLEVSAPYPLSQQLMRYARYGSLALCPISGLSALATESPVLAIATGVFGVAEVGIATARAIKHRGPSARTLPSA